MTTRPGADAVGTIHAVHAADAAEAGHAVGSLFGLPVNELMAVGLLLLAAGLLARAGRRVGLPTIPFFMAAGILLGPGTPGPVIVEDPAQLELLASFGLVLLLFTWAWSSRSSRCAPAAADCSPRPSSTSAST